MHLPLVKNMLHDDRTLAINLILRVLHHMEGLKIDISDALRAFCKIYYTTKVSTKPMIYYFIATNAIDIGFTTILEYACTGIIFY